MKSGRNPKPITRLGVTLLTYIALQSIAFGFKVPMHVFPDAKSTVLEHLEIAEEDVENYPQVLDSSLNGTWYWTTHKGEYNGYVSKRDIVRKKSLKDGTLIRVNPTHSSWILTKYQRGDDIRVKSRLSVGRVSIRKEIPLYFQLEEAIQPLNTPKIEVQEDQIVEELPEPVEMESVSQETAIDPKPEPQIEPVIEPESVTQMEPETEVTPAIPTTTTQLEEIVDAPITVIPELAEQEEEVVIDPLLEEKPRIDGQELVNMAPPPADLYQEFEGFLKIVDEKDANSEQFQYQLETRSGKRIVYVNTSEIMGLSYDKYLDQWINIRGTLEETNTDFSLFIKAKSIWVAP